MTKKRSAEKTVRDIRRATRRHYSAEEKIRIVLEGLRGEDSIAELCRRPKLDLGLWTSAIGKLSHRIGVSAATEAGSKKALPVFQLQGASSIEINTTLFFIIELTQLQDICAFCHCWRAHV